MEKRRTYTYIFGIILALSGCTSLEDEKLEQALNFAGSNRAQLETVLDHYAGDSLKLEAAKFLIRNMPGHCSYAYSDTATIKCYACSVDSIVESMKDETNFNIVRDSIDSMAKKLGLDNLHKVQDCHIVTSEFLIQNIDIAFYDWQHGAWAQHLDFENFCEWLLPYKMEEFQPLDDWRSRLKPYCANRLADLNYCDQLRDSPLAVAKLLNETLADSLHPITGLSVQYANIPLEHRALIPFGGCGDYASMTTTIFRSHGIPVVKDFTPQWAKRSLGHAWNVLLSDDGRKIPFGGICSRLGELHKYEEKMAKVYRNTYSRNDDLLALNNSGEFVPYVFRNIFMRDVTRETILCSDVILNAIGTNNKYAYLMVFDNKDWTPVAYGRIKNGKAKFQDVGRNVLYMPIVYENGNMRSIGNPFILDKKGRMVSVIPNIQRCIEMELDRKYPVMEYAYEYIPRLKDGEFQASNDASFKTYYVAHRIKEGHASGQRVIIPDSIPACRYWRYTNNRYSTFCSIAEIMLYAKGDTAQLNGKVIGTKGSWVDNPNRTREAVFDGDILTAFDAPKGEGCWAGLDLGRPVKLSHLIYYGRGDGNCVEIGDEYELLYWNKNKWVSLGKQKAKDLQVKYKNVPSNALYLFRNHTKGIDERVFTYENGKQVWW